MKSKILVLLSLLWCILASCSSSNESNIVPEITVGITSIEFGANGGSREVNVKTNVPLDVKSSADWLAVAEMQTTSSAIKKYNITAEPNTTPDIRNAEITITGGDKSYKVSVSQTFSEKLILEVTEITVPEEGGTFVATIKSTEMPTVSFESVWLSRVEGRALNQYEIQFSATPNQGGERSCYISFTVGALTESLKVTQAACTSTGNEESPLDIVNRLGLGWNLGNSMDSHNNGVAAETAWGNVKSTQALFNGIRKAGFATVRIPITWLGHMGAAPSYTVDEEWMSRVEELITMAENAELNVVINVHHDGANSEYWLNIKEAAKSEAKNNEVKAQIKALWTQIANRFKNKGNFLVFESFNEIQDGGWGWGENRNDGGAQYRVLNEWNQVFVDAVRATGGNNAHRLLSVPGYSTNPDLTLEHLKIPTDNVSGRLMVAVHYYDPYDYTLEDKYSEWGHTGKDVANYGGESSMRNVFGKLKAAYFDKGIPAYLGEVGCVRRSTARAESFRKYYLEYLSKAARDYNLPLFFWDNGASGTGREQSGLFNRTTGDYINNGKEIVDAMVKGFYTTDPNYTLDTVYNNAPK